MARKEFGTPKDLRREIVAALIAVKPHLDTPYPDDARWTPWTRFVERALARVDALASVAAAAQEDADTQARFFESASRELEAAEAELRECQASFAEIEAVATELRARLNEGDPQ